jgi:conjugal transfer pilus assembly protein TraF
MRKALTLALILSVASPVLTPATAQDLTPLPDSVSSTRDAGEDGRDGGQDSYGSADDLGSADRVAAQTGDDFYCRERRLGTWFYCDKPKARPAEQRSAQPARSSAEQLAAISKQLEELKARAILEPTPENISHYIAFQREQLDRASSFADMWQRTVWQNPDLDYTLQRPVSQLGKRTWLDTRNADRERVLSQISQRYGVFYFYSSACAACETFGPIMRSVSDRFGLTVMAISLDGGPTRAFPELHGRHRPVQGDGHARPAGARARPVRHRHQAADADRLRRDGRRRGDEPHLHTDQRQARE